MRSLLSCLMLAGVTAFAAAPAAAEETDAAPPTWVRQFITLDEEARIYSLDYFTPTQQDRDIRVESLDVAHAWRSVNGLELQARLGLFHADGSRQDVPLTGPPNSTLFGVSGGGVLRLYPVEFWWQYPRAHFFLQYAEQILYTGRTEGSQFPAGGTGVNGFARWGWGFSYDFTPGLSVEALYLHGHVSNGSGVVPQNPMWNGHGAGVALRYRF
ncbi:MAG TPA: hypothetical protein VGT99_12115 [Gammaproteobacteria bacterium]|nr:hypothetical protein [Gammaproteobacteria bacterium]